MQFARDEAELPSVDVKRRVFIGIVLVAGLEMAQEAGGLRRRRQDCRSTIFCLISAMALAGLRFLGQVLVQFMIVWQR